MGYLVAAHIAPAGVDVSALSALEPELGARAYDHVTPPLTVLEIYKRLRKDPWPFTSSLNRYNLSPAVTEQAPSFAAVVEALRGHGYGVPGIHGELNVGLEVSRLLACRVISFVADDESEEAFSIAEGGRLVRVRCTRGDLDLVFESGAVHVFPLVPSDEDPEEAAEILEKSCASALRETPGVIVHERERPWPSLLHGMVVEELNRVLFSKSPLLGLGTWDPPEDLGVRLVASRTPEGSMVRVDA